MRIDFHTHSVASYDGGLTERHYKWLFDNKLLDYIAITDHNSIDFALKMQKKFGNKIIVGEEVMTSEGEIIGLFLKHIVPSGLTPIKTVEMIKKRGGIVYIPHPFETVRHGLSSSALQEIEHSIDIIEIANGRTLQNKSKLVKAWVADKPHITLAAGSDAHSKSGARYTYTQTSDNIRVLDAKNTKKHLQNAESVYRRPPLRAFSAPKLNRLKKRFNL